MKKLKRLGVVLAVLAPLVWWFLYSAESGRSTEFKLDLEQVRALASSQPGEKPTEVRIERVGALNMPEIAVRAGAGWGFVKLQFVAWQLGWADGATVVVDSTMDRATHEKMSGDEFDDAAFTRVSKAMEQAKQVVVTHEHYDHMGGLITHPRVNELAGSVFKLTKEQLSDASKRDPLVVSNELAAKLAVLPSDPLVPIAPGVVLVKMPGHTPGTLAVYVQRADGEEYLFVSDVSWHEGNWKQVRERARAVTTAMGEDREAVLAELAAIKRTAEANPKLHVVPGHDSTVFDALTASGAVTAGFR